jgi:hypothetical protein
MFALVESGSITSFPKGNRGIKIGDYNYPPAVFTLWSESERNAIGIYTVEMDNTNKKDEDWYINTGITYAFGSGKVTGSYGTATAKAIADANAKDSDGNELDPVVVIVGLKTIKKRLIDLQCAGILAPSDWRVIREQETGDAMDSDWKTWRGNVRTKCNSMQTQIGNAANVDALAALFTYTKQEDDSVTRPLGEFPIKE